MTKAFSFVNNVVSQKKHYIAMIFVQFAYAGMALFSKAAISKGMNPFIFVAYRQGFALIALAPFALFLDRNKADHPLTYSLLWKIFFVSLFGITFSLNLYTYAMNYVSATFASASINTIPALTFLIAAIFRIESFSMRNIPGIIKFVGLVVSLSGAMVFAFVKGPQINFMNWSSGLIQDKKPSTSTTTLDSNSSKEENWVLGCLLMLLANTAWATWLVIQAPLVKQYPAKFRLTMLQCLFSFVQSSVWGLAMERNVSSWRLQWDFNLFSVAYCGVVVTGLCYWLQVWVVEDKGPLFTSTFTPLILIITAIFSAFIWKEMLYLGSICGGVLLVVGLYCVLWGKNNETEHKANKEKPDFKEEGIV